MAPKLVTPYRMSGKRGKNDTADAAAITEAMQRPNMRFVPVKTIDQQARLLVHPAREGFVVPCTTVINRQYSSGGKPRLGRITKAGDGYLRSLLVIHPSALPGSAKGAPTTSPKASHKMPSAPADSVRRRPRQKVQSVC